MVSPATETLISKKEKGCIKLDRIFIPQCAKETWKSDERERLYYLLDARGYFEVNGAGTKWRYWIGPDTIVLAPSKLEHTLWNAGDSDMRLIVFLIDNIVMQRIKNRNPK